MKALKAKYGKELATLQRQYDDTKAELDKRLQKGADVEAEIERVKKGFSLPSDKHE